MPDLIALPQLAGELNRRYGNCGPGYFKCHRLAADGLLPVVRRNSRIYVETERVAEIAALLGIVVPVAHHVA